MKMHLKGLNKTLKSLNRYKEKQTKKEYQNLIRAGMLIKREAQKRTPVDLGNLKASAFVAFDKGKNIGVFHALTEGLEKFQGDDASTFAREHATKLMEAQAAAATSGYVFVGFTAAYAIYVHEDMNASHLKLKSKKGKSGKALMKQVINGNINARSVKEVGQAKFLERAIIENRSKIKRILQS